MNMGTIGLMLQPRRARIAAFIAVRVVVVTTLCALLAFAAGLLVGILAIILSNAVAAGQTSMAYAYRNVAAPFAAIVMVVAFVGMVVFEYRNAHKDTVRMA